MNMVDIPGDKTAQLHPVNASVNKTFQAHLEMECEC